MKSKRPIWIPVVAALIKKDQQVLLGKRPPNQSLPGQWEFPGGKIELGESPEQALQRELKEELGVDAEIEQLRFASSHSYGEIGILLLFFEVLYWKGEPKCLHHSDLRWVYPDQIEGLDIPDANRRVLGTLVKEAAAQTIAADT